jgi:hypothetical protein
MLQNTNQLERVLEVPEAFDAFFQFCRYAQQHTITVAWLKSTLYISAEFTSENVLFYRRVQDFSKSSQFTAALSLLRAANEPLSLSPDHKSLSPNHAAKGMICFHVFTIYEPTCRFSQSKAVKWTVFRRGPCW